jgi:nucleoid-associated protein YgaU
MRRPPPEQRLIRALIIAVLGLIGSGLAVLVFWRIGRSSWDAVASSGPDSSADVLILCVAAVGMTLSAWLGIGLAVSALAALPGAFGKAAAIVAAYVAPALVRRAAAVALGTALSATAAPALAHADGISPIRTSPTSTASVSHDLPPDPAFVATGASTPATSLQEAADTGGADAYPHPAHLPASAPRISAPLATDLGPLGGPQHQADPSTVTVVRGDSLWRIAARHLGPGATDAEVALEWPRWYAANRAVIGPDPAIIHAGQVLTVPGSEGPRW